MKNMFNFSKRMRRKIAFILAMALSFTMLSGGVSLVRAEENVDGGVVVEAEKLQPALPSEDAEQPQTPDVDQPVTPELKPEEVKPEDTQPSVPAETVAPTESQPTQPTETKPEATEAPEAPEAPEATEAPEVTETPETQLPQDQPQSDEPQDDEVDAPLDQLPEVPNIDEDFTVDVAPATPNAEPFDPAQYRLNYSQISFDLQGRFKLTGRATNAQNNEQYADISQMKPGAYAISRDTLTFGTKDYNSGGKSAPKQLIALTSDYRISVRRPFIIRGKVKVVNDSDGFAIAFHNDKSFKAKNMGGTLGFYKHESNPAFRQDGVSWGTVLEIDTWDNYQDGTAAYAEPAGGKAHISVVETLERGYVNQRGYNGLKAYQHIGRRHNDNPYANQEVDFIVEWDPRKESGALSLQYGQYKVAANKSQLGNMTKMYNNSENGIKGPAYITFGTVVNMQEARGSSKLQLTEIRYTDVDPDIKVNYYIHQDPSKKWNYVMPGETFSMEHEFKNNISSTDRIEDALYKDKLEAAWGAGNKNLNTGRVQYLTSEGHWGEWEHWQSFPFTIFFHDRQKVSKFRYPATVPSDGLNYGDRSQIDYDYRIGPPGMSQLFFKGSIPVRTKNKITAQGQQGYYITHMNDPSKVNEDFLWRNIKVKSSGGNYSEETINRHNNKVQDMTVSYDYFVDDQKVGQRFPAQVEKNKTYSLKVTITSNNGDARLTNSVVVVVAVSDNFGTSGNRVIIANNPTKPVKETVLNTVKPADFANNLLKDLDVKAFEVSETANETVKKISASVNLADPDNKWVNNNVLDKKIGTHPVTVQTDGNPQAKTWPKVTVTENTWSYDDGKGNDTSKGEPGYIIIPSGIRLTKQQDKLVGEAYVKFADYNTDKTYEVSVNKTTTMTGRKNPSNTFDLTVPNVQPVAGDPSRVVITGSLSKTNKEVKFNLQSDAKALQTTNVEDTWNGTLTFYFKQN